MYAEIVRSQRSGPDAIVHTVYSGSYLWTDVQNLMKKGEGQRPDFAEWAQQIDASLRGGSLIVLAAQVYKGRSPLTVGYAIADSDRHEIESLWVAPEGRDMGIANKLYGMCGVNIGMAFPAGSFPTDMRGEIEGLRKKLGGTVATDEQRNVLTLSI